MVVGKYVKHTRHRQRLRSVDASDAAFGDGRRNGKAVGQPGNVVLGGVFRSASNLGMPVDPGHRLTKKVRAHAAHFGLCSSDAFVDLRLRRATCRLTQCAYDRASRQLDLEVIVAETARLAQDRLGGSREGFPRGRSAAQLCFSSLIAPRLMSDATECEARLPDHPVLDLKS